MHGRLLGIGEIATLGALLELLSGPERRRLGWLSGLLVIAGLLEMLGLGVVFLYIGLLNRLTAAGPAALRAGGWEGLLAGWPVEGVALAGGLALLLVFLIKVVFVTGVHIALMRFTAGVFERYSVDLLRHYLEAANAPLGAHRSAEVQRDINVQPPAIFGSAMVSLLYLAANAVSIGFVAALLLIVEPLTTLFAVLVLGSVGGVFYALVRRQLARFGEQRHRHTSGALRWVGHAIGGIREILISNRQDYFIRRFHEQVRAVAQADRRLRVTSQIPNALNEITLIFAMVGIVLLFLSFGRALADLLPSLAMFAIAGIRVMGMMVSMNGHFQNLQFQGPVIRSAQALVRELSRQAAAADAGGDGEAAFAFERGIEVREVAVSYDAEDVAALNGVSLEIGKGQRVAVVGPTGSGKSTLLSVIMGLLPPTRGEVRVDGAPIARHRRAWFANIGYVPQRIYLLDGTVKENILFGAADDGEEARLWRALEQARLAERVRALPGGLEAEVGEDGSALSGGERQRLGIARVLYHRPALLILDEATSALDSITEDQIFEQLRRLPGAVTTIIVTHRVHTLADCDAIYLLRAGRIAEAGSYEQLLKLSPEFRQLARATAV